MSDTEPLDFKPQKKSKSETKKKKSKCSDDFVSMGSDFFSNLNIKIAFFIFIIGCLIFNDIFIDQVLSKIDGASYQESATNKGVIIQLIFLSLGYLLIDRLVDGNIL